ncbi:MAG: single-stranded DNA-binding protein [Candidatus Heimdallarchaeaceae archaeon]|jgi:single-strand DNA-binding protein
MRASGIATLVIEPELRETTKSKVLNLRAVVDEWQRGGPDGKGQKVSHFFDFVLWDKGAETFAKYSKKGGRFFFHATPRTDEWEDKETGKKRSRVVFRIDEFKIIDFKEDGDRPEQKVSNESEQATPHAF